MVHDGRIDALCRAAGIALHYLDAEGVRHDASEAGKRNALEALGFGVGGETQIADSLARIEAMERRPLPPLVIVDADRPARIALRSPAHEWALRLETGATLGDSLSEDVGTITLPAMPAGYHRLAVRTRDGVAEATIVVAPRECYLPPALAAGGRAWGATAQVYSLRSANDIGIGSYGDVADLAGILGDRGASFLGLSPVHALFGADVTKYSPYSPSSRLFLQTALIAPGQAPGFDPALDGVELHAGGTLIDYRDVLPRQRAMLESVWRRTRDAALQDIASFRRDGGRRLEEYAAFEALSDHFKAEGRQWLGEWPAAFRDVHSPEVAAFRETHGERIAFHVWLQWLANRQLSHASAVAREKGMAIGLYRDLAVGADRGGAECWSNPDLFLPLSVGAPPDPLGPQGQDWGLPPINPLALAETGLAAFRELVAANMRYAGALRIDHAFQLQRLFVLPLGGQAADGVYLAYPFDALLAVLKIESHRARCLVIGEDLGTAPAGFSETIMDAGILSYRLLPFERDDAGHFKPPSAYPARSLAAFSTHDLPTFAGWWRGLEFDVRECLGVFDSARAASERAGREHERRELVTTLLGEGLDVAADTDQPPDIAALRYLARTPSALVAVQLEDILRERQQANLPGPDCGHPNWRRRSSAMIEEITAHPGLDRVAAAFRDERRGALNTAKRGGRPTGTYRLQLHAGFTFDDAAAAAPYLARLGVSHVYVSPVQMARPGSTHGYDVVDPRRLNPELGGDEAFARFCDTLNAHGLRLMVDIVPNHLGVDDKHNPWWLELLEWGRLSPQAQTFDVDWEKPGAGGKLVVPFLGEPFEDLLEKGYIGLGFEADIARFAVWYSDHCHPVSPLDYAALLERAQVHDEQGANTLRALVADFRDLGLWDAAEPAALLARGASLRRQLAEACAANYALRVAIERITAGFPRDDLRSLCERQAWRMAYWADANRLINYRRFFDITSLAGVRVEDRSVFEATHRLIFDLVEQGRIHALRIDHVDGLADPAQYLVRLQERVGPEFYIVVEKILEPGEALRPWPVAGTTGYDALTVLDALFFANDALPVLDAVNRDAEALKPRRALDLYAIRSELLKHTFVSEFDTLLRDVEAAIEGPASADIASALHALLAAFPVYRSYATGHGFADEDRAALEEARRGALEKTEPALEPAIDAVLIAIGTSGRALRRFQQLTGPLMAKSFEDTLFYRDASFIAANEVGSFPAQPAISADAFHRANVERLRDWPDSLIATSTHDTKRGEDARGRLLAASHLPDAWRLAWGRFRSSDGAEGLAPDDLYFLFQSLIASCPIDPTESERKAFSDRATGFVEKFLREAKVRSSWTDPDTGYEARVRAFVERCASAQGVLFKEIVLFVRAIALAAGRFAVARTVLKCTIPGVPDTYQGTELIDLSFVDPDNRRPVDFDLRAAILTEGPDFGNDRTFLSGEAKLFALATLLRDRRERPAAYRGAYAAIETSDDRLAIAFTRGEGDDAVFVAARRALAATGSDWRVALPEGQWRNLFDGRTIHGDRPVDGAELFGPWPAAVLRRAG